MHRIYLILLSVIMVALGSAAQQTSKAKTGRVDKEKTEWLKEMQQCKVDYIAKSLQLTEEQKASFVPLYNDMDNEVRKEIERVRTMTEEVKKKGLAATDAEKLAAAQAQWDCKAREAAIESKYFARFKKILTPEQLLKLKDSERGFMKKVMKSNRDKRSRDARKTNKSK